MKKLNLLFRMTEVKNQRTDYSKRVSNLLKFMVFSFLLIVPASVIWAQNIVTGTVTGSTDNEPLIGATVVISGTTTGTTTDIDGKYSLEVPDEPDAKLSFSYVGYITEEIAVAGQSEINVILIPSLETLEEVVVVGYGIQRKSLVTGSIAKIESEDISNATATRFEQALQGKTSGVVITQNSGSPGSKLLIKIRGNSSYANNDPLIIVDGIKLGTGGNGLEYLNPDDIESVEILKDAASSAIYGSEGGNGVILITTKKGTTGAPSVQYRYEYSLHKATNITKVMNNQQYVDYFTEAANTELTGSRLDDRLAILNEMGNNPGTVWTDEIFVEAPQHEHSLSFSGGSERSTIFASAAYLDQDGVIGGEKDNLKRYSIRINAESELKPWLTVGTNVGYTRFKKNDLGNASNEYGGIINNALTYDPSLPVVYSSVDDIPANYLSDSLAFRAMVRDEDGNYYSKSQLSMGEAWNPVAQIDYTQNTYTQDKVVGRIYGELKPLKWIKFTSSLNIDYAYQLREEFNGLHFYGVSPLREDSDVNMTNRFDRWYTYSIDNYLTITRQFGNHSLELMGGQFFREYLYQFLYVRGRGIPYNSIDFAYPANVYNTEETNIDGHARDHETQASYFGRLVYNYKERYMFQSQFRRDGSSKFGPDKKYGFFPSFSAGWIISKEDFFMDIAALSMINSLKLRGSWGRNGSTQGLEGYYPYVSTMITTAYYQDGNGAFRKGAVPGRPGNPSLLWETSQMTDIGLDMALFGNALTFSMDYFVKSTIDQITEKSDLPAYMGFQGNPFVNKGEVQNKGVEFDLGYRKMEGELKYSLSFNASYLKNEVIAYGDSGMYREGADIGQLGVINRYEPGYPVWFFYVYEADGIFQTEEEIDSYVNADGALLMPRAKPGDVRFIDQPDPITGEPSGRITQDDRKYLGKPMPDWVFGLNINLNYKGFDLGLSFQGQTGNQIYWAGYRKDRADYNRPEFFYTERWHGPGTSDKYPRASYNDLNDNLRVSSLNLYDGDYLRLKYFTFGYTLPAMLTSKIQISNLRIYLSGTNLITWTKYPGMDPEVGMYDTNNNFSYGIDRGVYPPTRILTMGVNVTF
jgi:TonB-linked SusC/RagA family outer membrane protein